MFVLLGTFLWSWNGSDREMRLVWVSVFSGQKDVISDQRLCLFGTILIIILDNTYCNVTLIDSSPVQYLTYKSLVKTNKQPATKVSGLTLQMFLYIDCIGVKNTEYLYKKIFQPSSIIWFIHLLSHSNLGYFLQWWVFHENIHSVRCAGYYDPHLLCMDLIWNLKCLQKILLSKGKDPEWDLKVL